MLFFYEYKIQNNSIFFSNNLKFFTITFDQFNASLLKKSIHFIQSFKNLPDPKLLNGSVCLSCSPGNYNSLKNIAVYVLLKSYNNYMKCIVTTVNPHVAYFI